MWSYGSLLLDTRLITSNTRLSTASTTCMFTSVQFLFRFVRCAVHCTTVGFHHRSVATIDTSTSVQILVRFGRCAVQCSTGSTTIRTIAHRVLIACKRAVHGGSLTPPIARSQILCRCSRQRPMHGRSRIIVRRFGVKA